MKTTSGQSALAIGAASHAFSEMQARLDATLGDISRLADAGIVLVISAGRTCARCWRRPARLAAAIDITGLR